MKKFFSNIKMWLKVFFGKEYIAHKCKHKTKLNGRDGNVFWSMPLDKNGSPRYCITCLKKQSVPCSFCFESINVGEQIALMSKIPEENKERAQTLVVMNGGQKLADAAYPACSECSDYMLLSAWLHPDHEAEYFGSVLERLMSSNGDAVIVSDCSRIAETAQIVKL